ncbi:unnamed protein product [Vitrella brassicaformis CCMP3155]|uniref:Exportin-1/Importin-beta-like domain-containing protein n=1 Tax=Vitrella brassicaformis (strain CCMP3155) TaxID=1169540 RepID=A0A0G4GVM3_VITBC|nr:unnamed protein product [Vitrella brassicaformis CCMP3155]|eukprot:CEM34993.1 unnamed protein product [Vitrella brassicaformis CCMP3155]
MLIKHLGPRRLIQATFRGWAMSVVRASPRWAGEGRSGRIPSITDGSGQHTCPPSGLVAQQRSTFIYDHSSACEVGHRLVTHDSSQLDGALVERVHFFGYTLFREASSRQWQRWIPKQRASVKAVLLSYPSQLPADCLRSPTVQQQCAVALSEVARREWPQCWQELMPNLLNAGRTNAAHAIIVIAVIRELAQECSNESTRGLPQRWRLEIEGGEALLRAASEIFRDLSQVVSVSRLVELQVDEFLSSNLSKSDACRKMNEVAMQVAYILSEFLETSGEVLLQRLPADTIAVLWRHGVVRLMRNASMDLVAAVLRGAAMCTKQLGLWAKLICATFRGWAM